MPLYLPPAASSSAGITLLNSGTVSAAATLDIVLTSYTAYRGLRFVLSGFKPASNSVNLYARFSTDGGSSYATTTYRHFTQYGKSNAATVAGTNSNSAAAISILGPDEATSDAALGADVIIDLFNQTSTAFYTRMFWSGSLSASFGDYSTAFSGSGERAVAEDTDAIRFLFSSGNIASGSWALYGYS